MSTQNPNGTLLKERSFVLHFHCGTATSDGNTYVLATSSVGAPIIMNEETGLGFAFHWTDLIDQAIAAGINGEKK